MWPLALLPLGLIIARAAPTPAPSPLLVGPSTISPCEFVQFAWSGGIPPYSFWKLVDSVPIAIPVNDTALVVQVLVQPGETIGFYVTDNVDKPSNSLSYVVTDDYSACSVGTTVNAGSPQTATRSVITIAQSMGVPTYPLVTTSSTYPYTTLSVVSDPVLNSGAIIGADSPRTVPIWVPVVASVVAVAVIIICILVLFYWRRVQRRRKGAIYQENKLLWTWRKHRGSQPTSTRSRRRRKDAGLMASTPATDLVEDITPTSTPFQSTAFLSAPAPQGMQQVIPSSKELRMRPWEARNSQDTASISDISEPLSTLQPSSFWPTDSDAQSQIRANILPHTSRGPTQHSRSLQLIITRELEQILQHPQHSASLTSLNEPIPASATQIFDSDKPRPTDSSNEKSQLSLITPTPHSSSDTGNPLSSSSAIGRTPISRRDMEVLADMVAERLARDHGRDRRNDLPPSYS